MLSAAREQTGTETTAVGLINPGTKNIDHPLESGATWQRRKFIAKAAPESTAGFHGLHGPTKNGQVGEHPVQSDRPNGAKRKIMELP
jgi:hypothetical protein